MLVSRFNGFQFGATKPLKRLNPIPIPIFHRAEAAVLMKAVPDNGNLDAYAPGTISAFSDLTPVL
jgi:hypothetical protein